MSELSINGKLISNTDIVVNGGEVKTGATWNGKPVYAKAISSTYNSNISEKAVSHGISTSTYGDFHIIKVEGYGISGSGYFFPLNWNESSTAFTSCFSTQSDVRIKTGYSNLQGRPVYITIFFVPE